MKIIFVRHGEPDYSKDSLTPKGWREAELLAERISKWNVTEFYCSPLGRAKDTASCTLKKMKRTAKTLPWMREFSLSCRYPIQNVISIPWIYSFLWSTDPLMHDINRWVETDIMNKIPICHCSFQRCAKNL